MPRCPECKNDGRKVKRVTLESLLCPDHRAEIREGPYSVCSTPECETVYFGGGRDDVFSRSDLAVRFGLKETGPPRPVCYCFDHDIEDIHDEIRRTGRSTVLDRIKADMQDLGCRCEYTNPLGACCLNTVKQVVQEGFRAYPAPADAVVAPPAGERYSPPGCRENDLIAGTRTLWLFWGLPITAFLVASFLPASARTNIWAAALLWAGIGCLINSRRCGRLHCYATGPLWILGSAAVLLNGHDIMPLPGSWIAIALVAGTILAFVPEWAQGRKYRASSGDAEVEACCNDSCCATEVAEPQTPPERTGLWAAIGSVLSAALASACCWLPLLLIAFGASAAGVAGFFEPYRPYFITAAILFLSIGFYRVYLRKEKCSPDSVCASPNHRLRTFNRATLWVATALVAVFGLFPNYVGSLFAAFSEAPAPVSRTDLVTAKFRVQGMTCEGCATTLRTALAKLPDVKDVEINYAAGSAAVRYEADKPVTSSRVIEAAKNAGFEATLAGAAP